MRKLLTVLACAVAAGLWAGGAAAQQPARRAAGLDVVPADGFAFVSVNVAKFWDTAALKGIRDAFFKLGGVSDDVFEKEFGLAPADLDRVTILWPAMPTGPRSEEPIIVVTSRKPANEAKLLKALGAETFAEAEERRRRDMRPAFPDGIKKGFEPKGFPPPPFPGKGEIPPGGPPPFPGKEPIPFPIKKEPVAYYPQPREEPRAGGGDELGDLFVIPKMRRVLYLLDSTTAVFLPMPDGDPQPLLAFLAKSLRRKADGPLAEALAVADKHTVVAGLDFRPIRQVMAREERLPRDLVPFRALLKTDGGFATLDLDAKSGATVTVRFANADDAARAEPVLKTAIQFVSEELGKEKKHLTRVPESKAVFEPLYDTLLGALDKATVKQDGPRLVATVTAEIGPAVEKALAALPAYAKFQAEEVKTQNNLKQIGLALHNFHDANGFFPQDIVDRAGKPILSWRVQILPYIEQHNLYRQLDLTKPWDDPGNAKVLAKMPEVFKVFGREAKDGETFFQMFAVETPVPGGNPVLVRGAKLTFAGITDGLSNTFGVVEAAEGVNWAKPGDIPFDPKKLPALGDPKTGKFRVMMLDGSVRTLTRNKLSDDQLRALITRDGGEVISIDD